MPSEAEERAHKIAEARAILHQSYIAAAQILNGGVISVTARDIANLDALDQIVIDYMVDIHSGNALDQTAPRTIATRAHVEGLARAEAVRVIDHHDGELRDLLKSIREAAADLGRQARGSAVGEVDAGGFVWTPALDGRPRHQIKGVRTGDGAGTSSVVPTGNAGFGVGPAHRDPPPPPEGPPEPNATAHSDLSGEGATPLAEGESNGR